jgi:hypothetical protein
METTEARMRDTHRMLTEADIKVREARLRHQTADILFDSAHDLNESAQANLNRAVKIRRRMTKLDLLVILLIILLATHVI